MSEGRHDLLMDPLLRVREPAGRTIAVSLPDVFARLSRSQEIEFVGLQPHQEHAWHAFLVQVAAMALRRAPTTDPFEDDASWRDALRSLSGSAAAWCLVVSDLSLPAFLQPPVPEGSLSGFVRDDLPDDLDVLVTARNHDVKRSRMARSAVDHWIYLLTSVQTTQGFSGRGNYGVVRMNGGFGNRPHVSYAPGLGRAERFRRDVAACVEAHRSAADRVGFLAHGGVTLTWVLPWDGRSSLVLGELDPWFIEACRRIRLIEDGDRVVALRRATERPRVVAREDTSDTADPWTPVDRAKGTSLTTSASGFGYDRTRELLLGSQFAMGAAGQLRRDDGPSPWFLASAMVRGQGRTDGIHERRLRVPPRVQRMLSTADGRNQLRDRSQRWVEAAKIAKLNVLGPALGALMGSGEGTKAARGRFFADLDARINRTFFHSLWETAEASDDVADAAWVSQLVGYKAPTGIARAVLADAIDSVPSRVAARYRAIAEAESVFDGCARRRFPAAFPVSSRGA